jgi:hypothetical protein
VEELLMRVIKNLAGRVGGPMSLRLLVQPTVAIILAIRAGLRDGREGAGPYFWNVLVNLERRKDLLREGWKSVGKLFAMACLLDIIYQLIVARWIYPLETLIVATVLALVPYVLLRRIVGRLARRWRKPSDTVTLPAQVTADAKESR